MMAEPEIQFPEKANWIFDVDGTLVDSNDAHAHAFIDAFEAHGIHTIGFPQIRGLIGMSSEEILAHVLPNLSEQDRQAIRDEKDRVFETRYMDQVQPFPGAKALFEALKAMDKKAVLCSASPPSIVQHFIRLLGIQELIEGALSGHDVPEGKPNPSSIEVCCQKFGLDPNRTCFVGDAPYDMIASYEYSVAGIGVLTGGYSREDLLKTGAQVVCTDLEDIRSHLHIEAPH